MLNDVGIALGVRPSAIEEAMTIDQIRLQLHWKQRAETRRMRIDEYAIKKALYDSFGGGG
jgi:hypothetical protein